MNQNDKKLIFITLIIAGLILLIFTFIKEEGTQAIIYHGNKVIQTIDLSIDNLYQIEGDLGKVDIEVKNHKIRVVEENSPYHLCSKQGYISNSSETIICMPNRIMIEIVGENSIDTQVK